MAWVLRILDRDEWHDEVLWLTRVTRAAATEITYIPGNDDQMFRAWRIRSVLGDLEIAGIRLAR